jgi:hypothetical protein
VTLSREQIEQMPAGPELDELVSRLVMMDTPGQALIRQYSMEICAAWEVVRRLRRDDWWLQVQSYGGRNGGWEVALDHADDPFETHEIVRAETEELAICRAALLAVIQ